MAMYTRVKLKTIKKTDLASWYWMMAGHMRENLKMAKLGVWENFTKKNK